MPILSRTLAFRTDEGSIIHSCRLDMCVFDELELGGTYPKTLKEFNESFISSEQIQTHRLSSFQTVTVQNFLCKLLENFLWFLSGQITEETLNKKRAYICDKSLKIMKLASKISCVSNILYLVMMYYKNCQYEQSLRCLQRAQDKMSKPYVTLYCYCKGNVEMYRRAMAGVSLSDNEEMSYL